MWILVVAVLDPGPMCILIQQIGDQIAPLMALTIIIDAGLQYQLVIVRGLDSLWVATSTDDV